MTVKIEIFGENASQTLEELRDLSRGLVSSETPPAEIKRGDFVEANVNLSTGDVQVEKTTPQAVEAKRERGKPAPGRARRTKEEIAEDEAADKADAAGSSAFGIQSGGERVNPEEAAQDAADEAAEDAANRDAAKPLTLDDVKNAVGLYVEKFGKGDFEKGRQIASEDGPGLFVDVLGPPPAGEPFWKFSILPSDQDKIAAMVKAWTDAANSGTRYQRKGA
ncbi:MULTISPECIES: hypothetical protein [unclassified Shinella]|uniref:hypothetical protein n=1 Tax=unclassified Shinella TaxID=2643062 RepID=UPI00225CC34A|nr:hypothetical protein SHINE37_44659 [Rhizobiaceae bacterium]CAK7259137.1 protein of unknown function [Shinella sp. WSC3-e]